MKTFGERLRAHRTAMGISSSSIEKATGIDANMVLDFEKGRRPSPGKNIMKKLADYSALNLPMETMIAWKLLEKQPVKSLLLAAKIARKEAKKPHPGKG